MFVFDNILKLPLVSSQQTVDLSKAHNNYPIVQQNLEINNYRIFY